MANTQDDFHVHAPDWREQIRLNQRRTRYVIAAFVALYALVGFVIDCLIFSSASSHYIATASGRVVQVGPSLSDIMNAILNGQVLPLATLLLTGVAVIALWITFTLHDKIMLMGTSYKRVDENSVDPNEKLLFHVVEEMKVAAGLRFLPKIFIIDADYMNAFASGYSEKSAMVAITRGLMNKLTREEMQAVMAHELSHIRHLDIKLTLTVAVLTNIMLIVIDVIFRGMLYSSRRRDDNKLLLVVGLLRVVLPLITIVLALFLSRTREYMADAGCVELMRDNQPLARALMKINNDYQSNAHSYKDQLSHTAHENVRQAAYIFDPSKAGFGSASAFGGMFSTHPPLDKRLAAIGFVRKDV